MSIRMHSLYALALLTALSARAHAQLTETPAESTRVKAEDILPEEEKNKPKIGEDVDDLITNKQMRAQSGSKSRWSFGSTWIMNGGSVERPIAEERPNISGAVGATHDTNLTATVGVAYKMTTTDRLSVDVGLTYLTPFSGKSPTPHGAQHDSKFSAADPDIMYGKVFNWGPAIQSTLKVGPTLYTRTNERSVGYLYKAGAILNNVVELGHSGLSLGLYTELDYNAFDKNDMASRSDSNDVYFEITPFVEYVLNDTFNLRTVTNLWLYQHDRDAAAWNLHHYPFNESVGVGISVTRDIFLYPNIQFVPVSFNNLFNGDRTNVAIEADINVF